MKRIAITTAVILYLAALLTWGQQAPYPAPATVPKPPTITAEQRAAYWKAQAEMQVAYAKVQQAQEEARQKQITSNDAIEGIRKTCGSDFQPSLNPQGDVECVAKPVTSKP